MMKKYSSVGRIIEVSDWRDNKLLLTVSKRLKVCVSSFKQVIEEYA
jgi:hypothetical protein